MLNFDFLNKKRLTIQMFKKAIIQIHMHLLEQLSELLGITEAQTYLTVQYKIIGQFYIIFFGFCSVLSILSENLILMIIFVLMVFINTTYQYTSCRKQLLIQQKKKIKLNYISSIRELNLALICGKPIRESYLNFLSSFAKLTTLNYVFKTALNQLQQGFSIEQTTEPLYQIFDESLLRRVGLLLSKYETTGNDAILIQLLDLQEEAYRSRQGDLKLTIESGAIISLLPAIIIFMNIMILLISPIFLGGLNL